jgi:type II secretory pathway pseudopilin PulG
MTYNVTQPRRGAALIITLVLLTLIGVVASMTLPQILRDRQEARMELLRTQSRQLLDDALRNAEAKRQSDSEFSGETFTLGPDHQPFPGTFLITTKYQDDRFNAEVEYRHEKGTILYTAQRQ